MKSQFKYKINSKLIKAFINENRLTVNQFCHLCDIGKSSYYNLMKSNFKISYVVFLKVMKVMHIEEHKLLIKKI